MAELGSAMKTLSALASTANVTASAQTPHTTAEPTRESSAAHHTPEATRANEAMLKAAKAMSAAMRYKKGRGGPRTPEWALLGKVGAGPFSFCNLCEF